MPTNLKSQQWPQDWKRSVFIPTPKKGNAKECSNYCTVALISHTSKVMLNILQASLQQYVNCEFPDKIMASSPITSWEIDGETVETVSDFIFWAPKSLQMVTAAMKLKEAYSLEGKL